MRLLGARTVAVAAALGATTSAHAVVLAQGVTKTEIVVGSHVDLSGPLSPIGVAVKNGLTLAFDEANAKGGVLGRRLRLVVEDNAYDPARATLAVRKLLTRDRVFAVLCPTGTPPVAATMPAVLKAGVLHLFPFTAADDTYVPRQTLEFAADLPVVSQIGVGLTRLLHERGNLGVGVLYRNDDFGRRALDGAVSTLARQHLKPRALASYAPDEKSFAMQIAQLRKAGADLVVLGSVAQETFAITRAAHARGWFPVFLCPSACYVPEVATLGGAAVSGLYAVTTTPNPYPNDSDPALRDWVKRYERRFHAVASAQALRAYLDARLFVEALKRTGPNPNQLRFARTLEAMPAWNDPSFTMPPIDYSPTDHLGLHTAFLAQIRGGRWLSLALQP